MITTPNLLNAAIEIEGLIRILMERDDADAITLLRQKSAAFAAQALAIQPSPTAPEPAQIVGTPPGATEPATDEATPIVGSHPGATEAPTDTAHNDISPIDIDSDISVNIVEFEEDKALEPQLAPAPEPVAIPAQAPKSFITFNEKYRFARELFNNEHAQMSDVLAKVSSMQSLAQAHDYVLNDLNLDEDNPVVIEFLEVIARYFNSRT